MKLWNNDLYNTEMHYYPAENKKSDACIVIFAGGGYNMRCDYEDKDYALFFQKNGIDSFTVDYHVAQEALMPQPLLDARRAVRVARSLASVYGYSPDKIAVMGSSAGGHLAAMAANCTEMPEGEAGDEIDKNYSPIPDLQILCYAVLRYGDEQIKYCYRRLTQSDDDAVNSRYACDKMVSAQTPPAFIWHTFADNHVDVRNSLDYASAMREHNVNAEIHIFPDGNHGLAMHSDIPHVLQWRELLLNFLRYKGWLE